MPPEKSFSAVHQPNTSGARFPPPKLITGLPATPPVMGVNTGTFSANPPHTAACASFSKRSRYLRLPTTSVPRAASATVQVRSRKINHASARALLPTLVTATSALRNSMLLVSRHIFNAFGTEARHDAPLVAAYAPLSALLVYREMSDAVGTDARHGVGSDGRSVAP